jgi:ferrous iron transport protein A
MFALTLAALQIGERAVVDQVEGGNALAQRLVELGFAPGTEVRVVARAPLGDPRVYEIRGSRLCLRRSEAACVRVRAVAGGPAPRG